MFGTILWIVSWLFYGVIIGAIARFIHHSQGDPVGFLPTVAIGISGSLIGGLVEFLLGHNPSISPSGAIMSIIGGVIACIIYAKIRNRT